MRQRRSNTKRASDDYIPFIPRRRGPYPHRCWLVTDGKFKAENLKAHQQYILQGNGLVYIEYQRPVSASIVRNDFPSQTTMKRVIDKAESRNRCLSKTSREIGHWTGRLDEACHAFINGISLMAAKRKFKFLYWRHRLGFERLYYAMIKVKAQRKEAESGEKETHFPP